MAVIHQPALATDYLTIYSQMHVQTKHPLAYLQGLIPTLAGNLAKVGIKPSLLCYPFLEKLIIIILWLV